MERGGINMVVEEDSGEFLTIFCIKVVSYYLAIITLTSDIYNDKIRRRITIWQDTSRPKRALKPY